MNVAEKTSSLTRGATAWIAAHGVDLLFALVFAALLVMAMLALRSLGERICRGPDRSHWRQVVGRTLRRTSPLFMAALAGKLTVSGWGAPAGVERAVQLLFVVAFAFQAAVWAREIILGVIEHRAGDDPGETTVGNALRIIRVIVSVALFAIAIVLILDNVGVNVTGLIAGLGIGGIAIGLAAQGIFSDLFAALSIIFDKPFRRGDTIKFGDATGTVEEIGLKTTRVRAIEGDEVVISNAKLLDQQIRNLADVDDRRVALVLPLLNRNDPAALATFADDLRRIVEGQSDCRFVHAWLIGFGAVTADLELVFRVDAPDPERMMEARHKVLLAALQRAHALGLEFNAPWAAPPRAENGSEADVAHRQ